MAEVTSHGRWASGKPPFSRELALAPGEALRSTGIRPEPGPGAARASESAEGLILRVDGALGQDYRAALRRHLDAADEHGLQEAYELGRRACGAGFGVLDFVRMHQDARGELLPGITSDERALDAFLLEALSPFEATHRGFRRAHDELQQSRAHYQRLLSESRAMEETLRQLSKRFLDAQEAERAHFSRELHDEVGQALNAISINLGTLARLTEGNAAAQARINDTIDLIARTAENVHRFARELRPAMLDELGLEAALRACVRGFAERTGITVEFHGKLPGNLLAADQRTVIYRVAQESLNNVAKHASATHVDVILWREGGQAILEIRDNGRGFARPPRREEPDRQRLGLLGMEERVRLVNGKFNIESRPGAGTIVRVEIPLESSASPAAEAGGGAAAHSSTPLLQKQPIPS
jgi:signal transduction histidine kinase